MSNEMKDLFGCWEMTEMKFKNGEGAWEHETVLGGTSIFTESGIVNTFTRTAELAFGYSGRFEIEGSDLRITLKVCSIPALESLQIIRKVLKLSTNALTLGMIDDATGREYEIDFKLLTRKFSA
jgi:hypothetical protein